ncbi:hypothetical protein LTR85_005931 [Meristemomyces frigidus]|nr:hypothetical protein LTR85_005931 [Meristemomyces frigidus]
MSGFEIVGIVLGTWPLLTAAAELMYSATSKPSTQAQYRQTVRNVRTEKLVFESALRELVAPLSVQGNIIDSSTVALLMDPGSRPVWKTPEVEALLKARLAEGYDIFVETMWQLQACLSQLFDDLDVRRRQDKGLPKARQDQQQANSVASSPEPDFDEAERKLFGRHGSLSAGLQSRLQRIKLKLRERQHSRLMQSIKECNVNLKRLARAGELVTRYKPDAGSPGTATATETWRFANVAFPCIVDALVRIYKLSHSAELQLAGHKQSLTMA